MPSAEFPHLTDVRRFFLVVICLWCVLLVSWLSYLLPTFQTNKTLPFGIFVMPSGGVFAQDFAYNMIYFRGIHDRTITHPYRLDEQEKLMRQVLPIGQCGLSHAYSPVAYVLARPLLAVSGYQAYLSYVTICALAIILLFSFYLVPGSAYPLQIYALAISTISVCLVTAFAVGQTALITTPLLGAFWVLLQKRGSSVWIDLALMVLFWMLCLKPSVALIPLMLLLGAQAWRPLALGLILLLITWLSVASHYGGFWTGLEDYRYLLNHYHNAAFSSFMQRGSETTESTRQGNFLFTLDRILILVLGGMLLVLRWKKAITLAEQFQGVIAIFLLFSPYLLPSEDWALCLLVVVSPFFSAKMSIVSWIKLLLFLGIFDLRSGLTFPEPVNFQLKCILFTWMLIELLQRRRETATVLA